MTFHYGDFCVCVCPDASTAGAVYDILGEGLMRHSISAFFLSLLPSCILYPATDLDGGSR